MSAIQRPKHLIGIGVWLTVIGLWTALYAYANYFSSEAIPICKEAKNYKLTLAYRETEIDLRPDCWSGEVRGDYKMNWGTEGHTPYQALFKDSYVYQGNSPDSMINEVIDHPTPIRFKGTGKLRVSLFQFENSVSHQ
jgi:hypothetical protein